MLSKSSPLQPKTPSEPQPRSGKRRSGRPPVSNPQIHLRAGSTNGSPLEDLPVNNLLKKSSSPSSGFDNVSCQSISGQSIGKANGPSPKPVPPPRPILHASGKSERSKSGRLNPEPPVNRPKSNMCMSKSRRKNPERNKPNLPPRNARNLPNSPLI